MSVRSFFLIFLMVSAWNIAYSIPQFSLLSGNRCSNCHVQSAGGGIRNSLGWYSYQDVSVVRRDAAIVKWLYSEEGENTLFSKNLTVGYDFRAQTTRSLYNPAAARVWFPMQGTVYGAYQMWQNGQVEGMINAAALRKAPNSPTTVRYPGQRLWMASAIVGVDSSLPTVRAGIFRPSYGMRYDDHTMFPYSYVTGGARSTFVAPDWGEAGVELTYESLQWLSVSAGVFGSNGLSSVQLSDDVTTVSAIKGNSPTITARAVVWPKFNDDNLPTYVGTSMLLNNDFSIVSGFVGIGLLDNLSLMLDYTTASKANVLSTSNVMVDLAWNLWSPILASVRFEHGTTTTASNNKASSANSVVVGSQVLLLPYVELRPEYRIWDTSADGYAARWNMQLHIFY